MPASLASRSIPHDASTSRITMPSVISRQIRSGDTPVVATVASSRSMKSLRESCLGDTLMVVSSSRSGKARCHARFWRQACSITQSPTGAISPESSRSRRNSLGLTSPRSGSAHRNSASTPTIC